MSFFENHSFLLVTYMTTDDGADMPSTGTGGFIYANQDGPASFGVCEGYDVHGFESRSGSFEIDIDAFPSGQQMCRPL
jgi:hypothetical protein